MPQQVTVSVENNFTKGLITESTGLNFPENAATDTDNCTYTLVGDVTRRLGINTEQHSSPLSLDITSKAISTYKWDNAGGDGNTQVVVEQLGGTLYFYLSSNVVTSTSLSINRLPTQINMSTFVAQGATFDASVECQYANGNGYLFVFNANCEPIYCSYNSGTITANAINVQIRDFAGIVEPGVAPSTRYSTLTLEHLYNMQNQGWTQGAQWSATAPEVLIWPFGGSTTFTVASGLAATVGQLVGGTTSFTGLGPIGFSGIITAYVGTVMTINITSSYGSVGAGSSIFPTATWTIVPTNIGYITTWFTAVGNYPSNSDVWWNFKNSSNVFAPATTISNVSLSSGNAPRGHYILNAFNQSRTVVSTVTSLTDVVTNKRPTAGVWFQGRLWFTGVNASQFAVGDAVSYSWSSNIYFSQVVQTSDDFGHCYQTNDPTSETLFDLLPTDGGIISIPESGSIYKLFALQNALLIFAANGVWYLTGSQGVGFSANDYTIVKLSSVRSIASSSFVDVNGLPYFWNEEGIYAVEPAKQGTGLLSSPLHVNPLEVIPITVGTIQSFYDRIPVSSKKHVRGAYDPIDYRIQWIYKSTTEVSVTDRYKFDKMLNYNTYNKAFFPYTIGSSDSSLNSILYVSYPGGTNTPNPSFKYACSSPTTAPLSGNSFAEEYDTTFVDWASTVPVNYTSFFVTGYKLRGQAIKKFQPQYVQVYSRAWNTYGGYKIQGLWNYAINSNSGKWSSLQNVEIPSSVNYTTIFRRHKIRGMGYILQFKITSQDNKPFDIQGWGVVDTVNQGT